MKTKLFVLGIALVAVIGGGSVAADTLLFYDGFNADKATNDIGYQAAERQSGSMASALYEERADTKWAQNDDVMSQITRWDSWGRATPELDLGAGNHWGVIGIYDNEYTWASPNANFNVGVYEISVKLSCWAYSGGSNESQRYTGILIGADAQGQRPDASTTGFGFVLTGNYKSAASGGEPTWKLYDAGTVVASGYMGGPGPGYWEEIHLSVDNTGPTAKVSVNNWGVSPLVTGYVSTQKLNNNYVTLGSAWLSGTDTSLWGMYDDLSVTDKTVVPEPSALVSLAVGALSMGACVIRRRKA